MQYLQSINNWDTAVLHFKIDSMQKASIFSYADLALKW